MNLDDMHRELLDSIDLHSPASILANLARIEHERRLALHKQDETEQQILTLDQEHDQLEPFVVAMLDNIAPGTGVLVRAYKDGLWHNYRLAMMDGHTELTPLPDLLDIERVRPLGAERIKEIKAETEASIESQIKVENEIEVDVEDQITAMSQSSENCWSILRTPSGEIWTVPPERLTANHPKFGTVDGTLAFATAMSVYTGEALAAYRSLVGIEEAIES